MYQQVRKMPWESLRDAVTADDAALTTFEYANTTYVANKYAIPTDINCAILTFFGKDAADKDAAVKLFGRYKNGPIMELYAGVVTLGAKTVVTHPITGATITAFWADALTSTGEEWITDVTLRNETADDSIAYLVMNIVGLSDVYLEIDLDGGSGVAMTELSAIITGTHEYIDE